MTERRKDTTPTIPERCPVCNKKKKKILMHIKATESCFKNIDSKIFDDWKLIAKKKPRKAIKENLLRMVDTRRPKRNTS